MMQCGSSLRGQDSGLTDDGGVFNNIFIIHIIRPLCRTLAVVRCVILPLSQFHKYQKINILGKLQTHQYVMKRSLATADKRLLILRFVHIVLSK